MTRRIDHGSEPGISLNSRSSFQSQGFLDRHKPENLEFRRVIIKEGREREGASFCVFVAINVTFTQFELRSLLLPLAASKFQRICFAG